MADEPGVGGTHPPASPARADRAEEVLRALFGAGGYVVLTFTLHVLLQSPRGHRERVVIRPRPDPPPSLPPPPGADTSPRRVPADVGGIRLTPTEAAVLDVLRAENRPLKGILIARRVGRQTCGSHLRGTLARLVHLGLCRHTPDGYELAGPQTRRGDVEGNGRGG